MCVKTATDQIHKTIEQVFTFSPNNAIPALDRCYSCPDYLVLGGPY